jgi:uncharacterized Zn-binding protein involved in type VI secretion
MGAMPTGPAARVGDMITCPAASGPTPHVGGPITPPGFPQVLIGGLPAARLGDLAACAAGGPGPIAMGSATVMIGNQPAARVGDIAGHGGTILPPGCPTVIIGG